MRGRGAIERERKRGGEKKSGKEREMVRERLRGREREEKKKEREEKESESTPPLSSGGLRNAPLFPHVNAHRLSRGGRGKVGEKRGVAAEESN